jgi:hypothetical protein
VKKRPLVIGDEFGREREELGATGGHTFLVLPVVNLRRSAGFDFLSI